MHGFKSEAVSSKRTLALESDCFRPCFQNGVHESFDGKKLLEDLSSHHIL